MAFIARREGDKIILPYVVGGTLTILHEAANGLFVVSWPSRKHWKKGYPKIPVEYQLARLLTDDQAFEAGVSRATTPEYPVVFRGIGFSAPAGKKWRNARRQLVEQADNFPSQQETP